MLQNLLVLKHKDINNGATIENQHSNANAKTQWK
jgi:hypothetical protein